MQRFDFLVIGGGIAGLTFALEASRYGTVAVLFKKKIGDSSTSWAQGGVAGVSSADDSFELHIEDTLVAGAGLCHRDIVELVVREAPQRINKLLELGVKFDRDNATGFNLHREGGHSRRRIFHAADATGFEIQRTLLEACKQDKNIQFFPNSNAIDLITTVKLGICTTKVNRALGAFVLTQDGEIDTFLADQTLVASGGAGKVYLYTSNPDVSTGDGIAMCYRAGCAVSNMEFFQFHPTCLYHPRAKTYLITEAMRGEGATLKRISGEPFMHRYHKDAELAPRDIVARAIDNEMKISGDEYVLLDIAHRGADFVRGHFPNIYERCMEYGIDISNQPIPVVPAAHYCCGGVVTDQHGCTEIESLYVAGEAAHTGLHGANRLASNSLLEGMVFGYRAAQFAIKSLNSDPIKIDQPIWDYGTAVDSDEQVVITQNWDEIRRFMWNYVGIVRSNKRLERALSRSEAIEQEIGEYYWNFRPTSDLIELRNLSLVARLIILSALSRKESRGLHYTIDYQNINDVFKRDTVIKHNRDIL